MQNESFLSELRDTEGPAQVLSANLPAPCALSRTEHSE